MLLYYLSVCLCVCGPNTTITHTHRTKNVFAARDGLLEATARLGWGRGPAQNNRGVGCGPAVNGIKKEGGSAGPPKPVSHVVNVRAAARPKSIMYEGGVAAPPKKLR